MTVPKSIPPTSSICCVAQEEVTHRIQRLCVHQGCPWLPSHCALCFLLLTATCMPLALFTPAYSACNSQHLAIPRPAGEQTSRAQVLQAQADVDLCINMCHRMHAPLTGPGGLLEQKFTHGPFSALPLGLYVDPVVAEAPL